MKRNNEFRKNLMKKISSEYIKKYNNSKIKKQLGDKDIFGKFEKTDNPYDPDKDNLPEHLTDPYLSYLANEML